jgi:Rrf2 family protein
MRVSCCGVANGLQRNCKARRVIFQIAFIQDMYYPGFMKLSDGVEWGLHCAVFLAALPPEYVLPGKALAEYHGVSETYLLKHLQALTRADILESIPGPKGGYRLAKSADQITLLAVVEAIEGKDNAFRCQEIRQCGPAALEPSAYRLPCAINVTMLRAEAAWKDVLRAQTLAELAQSVTRSLDPRVAELALPWLQQHLRR